MGGLRALFADLSGVLADTLCEYHYQFISTSGIHIPIPLMEGDLSDGILGGRCIECAGGEHGRRSTIVDGNVSIRRCGDLMEKRLQNGSSCSFMACYCIVVEVVFIQYLVMCRY